MKLLIFAFKPPPHHGQSYMVQLLLESLGGDVREGAKCPHPDPNFGIDCYHVDSRVSSDLADTGRIRVGKILPLLKYCAQAIWCRLRYGVRNFYYVPAPAASSSALYRDWVVMALCRPFFRKFIFHWHAAGLGDWLQSTAPAWKRAITRRLLGRPDLSIILTDFNRSDALQLQSKQVVVVPNGIPDPCPEFAQTVLPLRLERAQRRTQASENPEIFQVLFLSLCAESKGLFDAIEAVAMLRAKWENTPRRVQLTVAGNFSDDATQRKFEELLAQHNRPGAVPLVRYVGFVSGEEKRRLFVESDCLCFPTSYPAEALPVVLLEAMAFGLPIVVTRWRMIPSILPPNYPGLVDLHAPAKVMAALEQAAFAAEPSALRQHYLENYTVQRFAERMAAAIKSLETSGKTL